MWNNYPTMIIIEDFAYAGRFTSFDIAMQAGVIRHRVWEMKIPMLLIPPSSAKGWLKEEGMDVFQKDKKMPAIDFMEGKGFESEYHRKGDYNHVMDAGVLAHMGLMAHRLIMGELVGTPRQRDMFFSEEPNKKGQPKGLILRPEYFINTEDYYGQEG